MIGAYITIMIYLQMFKNNLQPIAEKHLQTIEWKNYLQNNEKDTITSETILGETVISELLQANTALFAFIVDPHGHWGPVTKKILLPITIESGTKFLPNKPSAQSMYYRSTCSPCPTAILQTANIHWECNNTHKFFDRSLTSPTPTIHTIQQLGLGILQVFATHQRL